MVYYHAHLINNQIIRMRVVIVVLKMKNFSVVIRSK